ncbi:MAG: DUF2244 domain-containing protein [Xanthobacteraceae bacterium]
MSRGNDFQDHPADRPLFSALITPNRSLGRTGFVVLMAAISIVSFGAGMIFLLMGAWPVLLFFGLDVAMIWWAFRVNYRTARAFEEIVVTSTSVRVRRMTHRGHRSEWTLNPLWVRLDRREVADYGVDRLYLVSRGQRLAVAGFLGAGEKAEFADALALALQAARRGPVYNPLV